MKVLIFQLFLHGYLTLYNINNDYYEKYKQQYYCRHKLLLLFKGEMPLFRAYSYWARADGKSEGQPIHY